MTEKRKLTPFLAHEMLYDYATGQLDGDRHAAIEAFIKDDRESQNLLEAIRRGIAYTQSLRSIEIKDSTLDELDLSENIVSLSKRLARWSEWPDSLRWSIIALAVSLCTAAVVVAIPWKTISLFKTGPSFDSSSIEIARVEPRKAGGEDLNLASNAPEESKENETGPLEGSGDEEFSDDTPIIPAAASAGKVAKPLPNLLPNLLPNPPVVALKPSVPAPVPKPVTPVAAIARVPEPVSGAVSSKSKSSRGFVYRAFMTLADLENVAPKITQQIKELGAEKAGEVELGWTRGSGRYYHFSIPETNEQKLLESLRVYGPVRISKDPHPRVMPEGQLRFILWIEAGK